MFSLREKLQQYQRELSSANKEIDALRARLGLSPKRPREALAERRESPARLHSPHHLPPSPPTPPTLGPPDPRTHVHPSGGLGVESVSANAHDKRPGPVAVAGSARRLPVRELDPGPGVATQLKAKLTVNAFTGKGLDWGKLFRQHDRSNTNTLDEV